jgi:hypothetical protein
MIDTVVLTGECNIIYEKLNEIPWTNNYVYEDLKPDGMIGEVYEYRKKGAPARIKNNVDTKRIRIETSIPKFLYGHNVRMITQSDIPVFFRKLSDYLRDNFYAYLTHETSKLTVQSMDVCWNFQVGGEVKEYIEAFNQLHIPKYSTSLYGDRGTIVWFNKSKRMKFYDKEQQVKDKKADSGVIELAKGILRFEADISYKDLKRLSKFRWAGELFTEQVVKELLYKHLKRLGIHKMLNIKNHVEVAQKLLQDYGDTKAQGLLGFIMMLNVFGDKYINKPSYSTYVRKMNQLKRVGIVPVFVEKELPPLDIGMLIPDRLCNKIEFVA